MLQFLMTVDGGATSVYNRGFILDNKPELIYGSA
jgi:hypothetical protein